MLREGEESLLKCVVAAYSNTLCFESLRRWGAPVAVLESRPSAAQTPFNTLSIIEKLDASQVVHTQTRGIEKGTSRWVLSGLQVVSKVLIAVTNTHFLASNEPGEENAAKREKKACPVYKLFTSVEGRTVARVVTWRIAELLSFIESANSVFQKFKTRRRAGSSKADISAIKRLTASR